MTIKMVSHADLASLVAELTAANTQVIAPVRAKENPLRPITSKFRNLKMRHLGLFHVARSKSFCSRKPKCFCATSSTRAM